MQMKSDQDALERRLWAKQEKLKAEHARSLSAEQDMSVDPTFLIAYTWVC